MHINLYSLLAGSLPPLGGLENFGSAIIPLIIFLLLLPVTLMLQSRLVLVQVPWCAGHVLRDVRIDLRAWSHGVRDGEDYGRTETREDDSASQIVNKNI